MHRSDRRRAEEALAQLTARRHALEELERDRVGLAPAAAALLAARDRFDGGVLGPAQRFRQHEPRRRGAGRTAAGRLDARRAGARPRRGAGDSGLARGPSARIAGPAAAGSRARTRRRTASRSTTGSAPKARLPAGSARRWPGPRCSTPPAGCSVGRAAPSSSPAPPPRRARSAAGPSCHPRPRRRARQRPRWPPPRAELRGDDRAAGRARGERWRPRPPPPNRRARPSDRGPRPARTRSGSSAISRAR